MAITPSLTVGIPHLEIVIRHHPYITVNGVLSGVL